MKSKPGFRLQPVLNYKSSQVDSLEVEFARLKSAHKQEVDLLKHLRQSRTHQVETLHTKQQGMLNCEAIQRHLQYLKVLDDFISRQNSRVEEVRHRVERKREELINTMQDRKTLEKLRERFLANQQRDLLRRETRAIDDLVITRYNRGK